MAIWPPGLLAYCRLDASVCRTCVGPKRVAEIALVTSVEQTGACKKPRLPPRGDSLITYIGKVNVSVAILHLYSKVLQLVDAVIKDVLKAASGAFVEAQIALGERM